MSYPWLKRQSELGTSDQKVLEWIVGHCVVLTTYTIINLETPKDQNLFIKSIYNYTLYNLLY